MTERAEATMDDVVRLGVEHEPEIEALLLQDEVVNLFLLGFLAVHPVDRAWWYGVVGGSASSRSRVRAAVLVLPARLAVPWAPDPADAAALGGHLAEQHRTCMVVGPREACDAMWARWAPGAVPRRRHDQRLYVLDRRPAGADPRGFRVATLDEWPVVARQAAEMEREDLGVDPLADNARAHEQVVQDRVRAGRTYVVAERGRIVFQVNVGTTSPRGCQIGGTWVPRSERGRGLATAGVAAACRRLLLRYPRVTLHVNEANAPAVRVYEKVGFRRDAAFRLLIP
jgi:predicted GNAT family acetyltransferase